MAASTTTHQYMGKSTTTHPFTPHTQLLLTITTHLFIGAKTTKYSPHPRIHSHSPPLTCTWACPSKSGEGSAPPCLVKLGGDVARKCEPLREERNAFFYCVVFISKRRKRSMKCTFKMMWKRSLKTTDYY